MSDIIRYSCDPSILHERLSNSAALIWSDEGLIWFDEIIWSDESLIWFDEILIWSDEGLMWSYEGLLICVKIYFTPKSTTSGGKVYPYPDIER